MSADQWAVVGIAAAWSGGVGVLGLGLVWLLRRGALRWLLAALVVVTVAAVLAGVLGTAQAMFLDAHDFGVIRMVAAVAAVVGLGLAALVAASISRQSRALTQAATQLAESGSFEVRSQGPAELTLLADELAATADKLTNSRRRERALENSRRELVSWVSHDLRTPLAGVRAMAEALEDGLAEDPERYHRQIRGEVDRMTRMVDDLFELSRIHAGVLNLRPQTLMLGDVVSDALASADPVARETGVRLHGMSEDGLIVIADPAELSRALGNLLTNAIRHTPAPGSVEIVGRAVPGGVEVSVTDACGGLSDDDMERVFEVAWQGSSARTPSQEPLGKGAGLGLAIVKGIVEAHRGHVRVENLPPLGSSAPAGCRFLVRLPV